MRALGGGAGARAPIWYCDTKHQTQLAGAVWCWVKQLATYLSRAGGAGGGSGPSYSAATSQSGVSCRPEKGGDTEWGKVGGEQAKYSAKLTTTQTVSGHIVAGCPHSPWDRSHIQNRRITSHRKHFPRMFCFHQNVGIRHGMECLIIFWRALAICARPRAESDADSDWWLLNGNSVIQLMAALSQLFS